MQPRVASYEDVPAEDWEEWIRDNQGIIVDVRRPEEWALGTLDGARKIVMHEIPSRLAELPVDSAILVVCRSGNRSARVAAFLSHNGYTRVANMTGGMKALGFQR